MSRGAAGPPSARPARRSVRGGLLAFVLAAFLPSAAGASGAIDAYGFADEAARARYERLIAELRCPQCLNTNLAGSDAMIARDLRREVRRLVLEGRPDREILDFMHARYGDFILYRPRLDAGTALLWFGPLGLLLAAGLAWLAVVRARRPAVVLSEEEQARLARLLGTERSP